MPQRATPTNPNVPQSAQGQSPSPQQAAQQAPPPIPAKADALPPDLVRAPAGTQIQGQVQPIDDQGRATIRTDQGPIRLELPRGLAAELLRPGNTVTIELRVPNATPALVRLLLPPPSQSAMADTAVRTASVEPRPTVPLALGRIVTATVVPGSTGTPVAVSAPQVQPAPQPLPTQGAAAPTGQPALPQAAPAGPAPPAPTSGSPTATPPPSTPGQPSAPSLQNTLALGRSPAEFAGRIAQYQAGNARAAHGIGPAATPTSPPQPQPTQTGFTQASPSQTSPAHNSPQVTTHGTPPSSGTAASTSAMNNAPQTAGNALLQNGSVLTVRIAALGPEVGQLDMAGRTPLTPTGLTSNTSSATPVVQGTIAGVTGSGRPVVQTPFGYLALDAKADATIGSRVALDVLGTRGSVGSTTDRAAPLSILAREWPAFDEMLRVMEAVGGAEMASQAAQNAVARPGPQLTAAILFLMTALRGGDPRALIRSETARLLESSGRGGLLGALNDDVQTLTRATEPSESGWRAFLIPFGDDEARRQMRILVRDDDRKREGEGKGGGPKGTAFLVDLELSRLGPFRLDGYARKDLIDLMIRTTKPLPSGARGDIQALFQTTLERTGITGHLRFRSVPVLPPLPIADLDAATTGDTTTVTV